MYKLLTILIIFFLSMTPEAAAGELSRNYDSLMTVSSFSYENSINSGNRTVVYHGSDRSRGEMILQEASNIILLLPQFFPELDTKCKDKVLHIYQISHSTLNNRTTMSFLDWALWGNNDITGVYDSRSSPPGESAIFITERDGGNRELSLISHEMTHYWQDTMCKKVNESDAYRFQNFFIENRN